MLTNIKEALKNVEKSKATTDKEFRSSANEVLNKTYEEYRSTHQDIIRLHDKNIELEAQLADSRSANSRRFAKSNATVLMLSQLPAIPSEVDRMVKMRNGLGEYSWMKGKFEGNRLDSETYEALSKTDQAIYECYKSDLSKYETAAPIYSKKYYDFLDQLINERVKLMMDAAWQQSELHQDRYRSFINEFYQQRKTSEQFQEVMESLTPMVTTLLTQQLKSQ